VRKCRVRTAPHQSWFPSSRLGTHLPAKLCFAPFVMEMIKEIIGARCAPSMIKELMKIMYAPDTDSLTITLRQERIKESDEVQSGVSADFGYDRGMVRFEILQASRVVQIIREIQSTVNA